MIAVLQRVNRASVSVEGRVVGEIGQGLLILLGVAKGDTEKDAERLAAKAAACRIFHDDEGKMNRSVKDIGAGALVISNFTLLADYHHGNRPNFFGAAAPEEAKGLYLYFTELLSREVVRVEKGEFGAEMTINAECAGPVTITMDSNVLKPKGERAI
jgi:D-tyrosyl-tRNA(Tyr) deacylase